MVTLSDVNGGVDVSKKHLDIHLHPINKTLRVVNSQLGIKQLLNLFAQYNMGQIVCEATGGYERVMYNALNNANYKVWRVEPKRIKAFIISEGIKAKTDKIDAKMIALFASKKSSSYPPTKQTANNEQLKTFIALKCSLTTTAAITKTQLKQAYNAHCIKILKKHLKFLEKEITKLEVKINSLIQDDKENRDKATTIKSIPGIGNGVAAMALALLPELGKINDKQVAALVGVAPFIKQSGDYKGKARISGGRAPLRTILYMAAISAIKHNTVIINFYNRLIQAGKSFKVAIVAVMRKLIVYMNVLVRKGELWNPII